MRAVRIIPAQRGQEVGKMEALLEKWQGRVDGYEVVVMAHGDDDGWDVEVSIAGPKAAWSSQARPVPQLKKKYSSPMVALELGKRWACDAIAGNVIGVNLAR
jgi:hypothetical protein